MKRKPVDESKLVQKYYIEKRWYSEEVNFSIVYGTVGAKEFMVKRRDDIVGMTTDIRIGLDHNHLFDDFDVASSYFKSFSLEMKERVLQTLSNLNDGISKVDELANSVKEGRK